VFYIGYYGPDKFIYFYVVDITISPLTKLWMSNFYQNECSTKPAKDIYVPVGYIYYGGKDYVASVSTDHEVGGKCTNTYGRFWIKRSNYGTGADIARFEFSVPSTATIADQGSGIYPVFFNPNTPILGENLGLPAFSGYTKCVDLNMQLIGGMPRSIALVFYEDT